MEDQVQAMLRAQFADIILGTIFVFIGFALARKIAAGFHFSELRLDARQDPQPIHYFL